MRALRIFGKKQESPERASTSNSPNTTTTSRRKTARRSTLSFLTPRRGGEKKDDPSEILPQRRTSTSALAQHNVLNESSASSASPLFKKQHDQTPPVSSSSNEMTLSSDPEDKLLGVRTSSIVEVLRKSVMAKEEFVDAPHVAKSYDAIPLLEQTKLPRGGVSVETKAVGRVQFGIPPETIKDSMRLGIPVPQVYIVPEERFCREMGPALGINLAEFEFPAYFNYFVYKKQCTLVVDSVDAEDNIRRVFGETLLGPAQFRREDNPITHEDEDFAPDFPREAMPNFQKEFKHWRKMPDGHELVIETLLDFRHFELQADRPDCLGVPPPLTEKDLEEVEADSKLSARALTTATSCSEDESTEEVPKDLSGVENREKQTPWTFSNAKGMGDVATVWPFNATPEQIKERNVPRVEIFKMPGGTEYIVHDIDENNFIIGKARLSGHVKVSESMSVDGFGGRSILDDVLPSKDRRREPLPEDSESSINHNTLANDFISSFHPPSFGVTVLGNSHGFDKSGSVSGYVLWINGRGVMIDPPPYASATLEREGIRPRTIVGIILTHCHADHDAGAFQKVLTGSPVVVITTPTIYKSFIRKYAALSALSPALLRHSHRYKPAVIGQPLRFQGATFHFAYTLHTIPCVGFRVEWRGRSMVFTGDHFNNPEAIDKLQEDGVLSKARADDLRNLPLQETDLLLHEAGAPPIHTPLDVLLKLPKRVKDRLYVVHTSALPEGCELRVAPTGTAGTIRLDQMQVKKSSSHNSSRTLTDDDYMWNGTSEYATITEDHDPYAAFSSSFAYTTVPTSPRKKPRQNSLFCGEEGVAPPLVSLRPASSTDAWFILNLLSAVPFLSSLSYASTMEVLETARVDVYSKNHIVVPAARRSQVLCVIWEGACGEWPARKSSTRRTSLQSMTTIDETPLENGEIWHAGDWTGPISLQPEVRKSGESRSSSTNDIVALSPEGVKVITIDFPGLHAILRSGSMLYRRFLDRKADQERAKMDGSSSEKHSSTTDQLLEDAKKDLNVLELLNCNSALKKLTAIQKRHLESLAVGPVSYQPGERLWGSGTPVDKAFIVVSGTASFVLKRRNAGSAAAGPSSADLVDPGVGVSMKADAEQVIKELGAKTTEAHGDDQSSMSSAEVDDHRMNDPGVVFDSIYHEHARLSRGLQKRAEFLQKEGSVGSGLSGFTGDTGSHDDDDDCENESQLDHVFMDEGDPPAKVRRSSVIRRRSSRARYANKVLGRLYSRRAFTGGLVFSRGHFLGDVSKMVAGLLSSDAISEAGDGPKYGFGDRTERSSDNLLATITEVSAQDSYVMHNSTLTAGQDGCVVLVFPKSSLIPFLDEYPGLLLSLLGTQVVV